MALQREKHHRDIISDIAKENKLDWRVVNAVATHPFLFVARSIRDNENERPTRIRYLGVFAIRGSKKKK